MVDYYPGHPLSKHPAVIAAAIGAFRQLGAREVAVADGPAHNRDKEMVLEKSGIDGALKDERVTATRLMGIHPEDIEYLRLLLPYGGTLNEARIRQLGEPLESVKQDFEVVPHISFTKMNLPYGSRSCYPVGNN